MSNNFNIKDIRFQAPDGTIYVSLESKKLQEQSEIAELKDKFEPSEKFESSESGSVAKKSKTEGAKRQIIVPDSVQNVNEPLVRQYDLGDRRKRSKASREEGKEFNIGKSVRKQKNIPDVITILHTNDLHGNIDPNDGKGGIAYVAGKIEELRENNPNVLLVDGGDISYAPPYSDRNRFNPMPGIMNIIGYDLLSAGNHEFQWEAPKYEGPEGNPNPDLVDNLKELQQELKFPLICANAVKNDGKRPDFLKPYIIKQLGDVKVGVIGVVTKRLATVAHPQVGEGWKILDQAEVLKQMIPEMKENGADLVVVLSHDNLKYNQKIISQTPGIDIMIGSHDHQITEQPILAKDPDGKVVPLVEAGAYGYHVGELKVEIDPNTKKPTKVISTLYPINTQTVKPDREINEIVDKWVNR